MNAGPWDDDDAPDQRSVERGCLAALADPVPLDRWRGICEAAIRTRSARITADELDRFDGAAEVNRERRPRSELRTRPEILPITQTRRNH